MKIANTKGKQKGENSNIWACFVNIIKHNQRMVLFFHIKIKICHCKSIYHSVFHKVVTVSKLGEGYELNHHIIFSSSLHIQAHKDG